jgi:hypothetical protein
VDCKPIRVKGVNSGDKPLVIRKQGTFQDALTVYHSPEASANIIAYCQIGDALGINWNAGEQTFHTNNNQFVFVRNGNLFTLSATPQAQCLTTLKDNKYETCRRSSVPS